MGSRYLLSLCLLTQKMPDLATADSFGFFPTAHTNTCNEFVFCKAQSKYLTKINKGVFFYLFYS